jgi:hypothetical protein
MHSKRGCPQRWNTGVLIACCLFAACGGKASRGKTTNPYSTSPAADGSCPSGTSPCGLDVVRCYALDRDPRNCGRCDNACTAGIACATGVCQQVACSGSLSLAGLPVAEVNGYGQLDLVADMNGDGKLDLVRWSETGGAIQILLGNGDGTFSPGFSHTVWDVSASFSRIDYVVVGDFDEDGIPDLAMAVPDRSDTVEVWFGNGDGSLRERQPHSGQPGCRIFAGDVNRDGHLDIVTSNGLDANLAVLLGRGDGTFSKSGEVSAGEASVVVAIRDWDADGIPDLVAMNTTLHLLLGTGNAKFAKQLDCQVAVNPWVTVIADFNQDGKQDVATQVYGPYVSVMLGDGRCGLTARTDYTSAGCPVTLAVGDVTGDGILDLVADTGQLVTLVGKGDGTFMPGPDATMPADGGYIVIGDYDGDGRADILVDGARSVQVEVNTCK